MMSSLERDVYVGELLLYTFRNLFPNDAPKAKDLFNDLKKLFDGKKMASIPYNSKTVSLRKFDATDKGFVKLLFWLVDPLIPDQDYANMNNGTKRTLVRRPDEEPVLSVHVLIDIRDTYDELRCYPMSIESVDNFPRSLIVDFLNRSCADHLSEERVRKANNDKKTFRPRTVFNAPHSHTLDGVLDKGGVLKSVKWVQEGIVSQTFGDQNFPVLENRDVVMSVQNKPTGDTAKGLLRDIWNGQKTTKLKKLKVTIDDEFQNPKTLTVDLRRNDILSNFFLKKETLSGFATPIGLCEDQLRQDIIEKMKKALKP
ncbi:MAG: hypothetical protein V3U96_00690 [Paracoccaceae bacterium]